MSAAGTLWTVAPVKHYGYGAGRADPSVEHVACPVCKAPKGELCREDGGEPKLSRHHRRCAAYRDLKRKLDMHAQDFADRFMAARLAHIKRGSPRLTRGSRFAICGFRGCTRVGRKVFTTGTHKYAERHWYCCFICGTEFTRGAAAARDLRLMLRARRY